MNAELLAGALSILMSLGFSYIPGLRDKFEGFDRAEKQLTVGILLIVIALVSFGLSCAGVIDVGLTCDEAGAVGLVSTLISALVANQSIYGLTKR